TTVGRAVVSTQPEFGPNAWNGWRSPEFACRQNYSRNASFEYRALPQVYTILRAIALARVAEGVRGEPSVSSSDDLSGRNVCRRCCLFHRDGSLAGPLSDRAARGR